MTWDATHRARRRPVFAEQAWSDEHRHTLGYVYHPSVSVDPSRMRTFKHDTQPCPRSLLPLLPAAVHHLPRGLTCVRSSAKSADPRLSVEGASIHSPAARCCARGLVPASKALGIPLDNYSCSQAASRTGLQAQASSFRCLIPPAYVLCPCACQAYSGRAQCNVRHDRWTDGWTGKRRRALTPVLHMHHRSAERHTGSVRRPSVAARRGAR